MKSWLYLFVFLLICFSVSASDINIITYRDNYSPLETFQAEIILDKEPLNKLSSLNFELSKDDSVGILVFLEKLSNKRYFVYFDIPNVEKGEYKFKVKNVNIIDGILKKVSAEKTINVNKINPGFDYLLENQNQYGSFNDISETSLSSLALKNIDSERSNLAIEYLLNNQDPTGCYPKDNCNVKDTSFALLALNKFNENYIKTKNWLKDASNNFELGTWNLRLSGDSNCGNIQVDGIYNLNIEDKEINITCENDISFMLTHNYLGGIHTINEYTGSNFNYIIDDSGCYGLGYKEDCDYISSLYASWALEEIGEDSPEDYLENNKLDDRTIDHAINYILYGNNYDRDWLLNNYLNGYWSHTSAGISQIPDYFVSSLSTYALRNEFLFEDAKEYLKDKTYNNVLDSSLILYLLFNDEENLPSVSITPGIVNKKNIFNFKIKNNKEPLTIFIESPNHTGLPKEVYLEDEINYNVNVEESFDIIIKYENYSYTIPVISKDQILDDNLPLLPPPREAIQFVNEDVNITLDVDDKLSDSLVFVNNWDFKLVDVKLNITGRLKEILEFEQNYFDSMESGETLSTIIHLNKDKEPKSSHYEGYLVITSSLGTLDTIKFSVDFEAGAIKGDDKEPSGFDCESEEECEEGEICNEENICVFEELDKEDNSEKDEEKSLWWVWLIIIILVVGIIIFILLRRKKEINQSFEEYAKSIKND